MRRLSKPSLLDDALDVLIRHFGVEKVRSALAKAHPESPDAPPGVSTNTKFLQKKPPADTVAQALDLIREIEPAKHRILTEFNQALGDRVTLPDTQDIRHFAQLIGFKRIEGKSRREMIPKLLRFLLTLPVEQLEIDIKRAASISERERQRGFSVLTDKLLGEK